MDAPAAAAYLFAVLLPTPAAPLSATQRATLGAVVRTVVPHVAHDAGREARLLARVEADLLALPPHKRRGLLLGMALLGSWAGALLAARLPIPLRSQSPEACARQLDRWLGGPLPVCRAVAHGLRRLILFAEYTTPEARKDVHHRGAYHSRGPAVPWEGALAGMPSDGDPVARAPIPAGISVPAAEPSPVTPMSAATPDKVRTGVVVIGSGAGGAVAAARLAEAGHEVLILEAGELVTGEELDEDEHALHCRLYAERGQRTSDDASLAVIQGATVGGGTTVNWMIMLRTPDWVLDEWAAYHGAEGMRPADLAPVFDRIEQEVHARLVPDDAHSPNNRIILDGARALGWSAFAGRINARDCVRAGFCGSGCRYGAKQGGLQTYLPRAQVAGARLVTHATATKVQVVERGGSFPLKRVTVRHAPPDGPVRDFVVEAPVVIVAAGAVETPALLQRSQLGGGGTGRFLRVHPTSVVFGLYDREIYAAGGIPLTAVCDEYLKLDGGYGTWIECPPLHSGLAAAALPGIGEPHRQLIERYANLGALIVLTRDGARRGHSDGEIRARRDGGISIRYRLGQKDAQHLEHGLVAASRLHFAAGARRVISAHTRPVTVHTASDSEKLRGHRMGPNHLALFTAHVNGTCRLGVHRERDGCDPHGEVFGAPGVFVVDGSLLPTALGVNPQETILALSSIVTERIAARRRPG